MASARVFQIHELAQHIIRYTCSRSQLTGLAGGSTLAALARVNRLLSTIAIAEIWRTLDSGGPLVNLLPPEINLRGVTFQDLQPYMKYGGHVKALNLKQDSPEICKMLERADRFVAALGLNDRHSAALRFLAVSPSHFLDFANYIKIRGGGTIENLKIGLDGVSQGSWFEEMTTSSMRITSLDIAFVDRV